MSDAWISAISSVAGMGVTGLFGYIVARQNNKKDINITDRQQLSKDEQEFRQNIIERMNLLQEQVDKYHQKSIELEETVSLWKNKYIELDKEWRVKYVELEIENKQLQNKVFVLEMRVKEKQEKEKEGDPVDV